MLKNWLDIQILKGKVKKVRTPYGVEWVDREKVERVEKEKWLESGKGFNGRMCLTNVEKEEVFKRANYRCQMCGKGKERIGRGWIEIRLVVHHLCYPPLTYDDLQAACYSCHNKISFEAKETQRGLKVIKVKKI